MAKQLSDNRATIDTVFCVECPIGRVSKKDSGIIVEGL